MQIVSAQTTPIVVRAQAGDTVATLAKRHGADVAEVAKLNGLLPASVLGSGREIRIPVQAINSKELSGFKSQEFEPSLGDELSRLELTADKPELKTPGKKIAPLADSPSATTCSRCTYKEYDKVTDETTYAGRKITITRDKRTGFVIETYRTNKKYITVAFGLAGIHPCVDANTPIKILFRDGTRLATSAGNSVFDCDGYVSMYFGDIFGGMDVLRELQTKEIETLRIHTFRSSLEQNFTRTQAVELMNQLKCLDGGNLK